MDKLAKTVYDSYPYQFQPPTESLQLVSSSDWDSLSHGVKVFYTGDNIDVAKKLATERDLVNIANRQNFDVNNVEKNLGWSESGYTNYFKKTGELPPQIGIYCRTPVIDSDLKIHVMNSIGLGFDAKSQPDFKHFSKLHFEGVDEHLANSFNMLFRCASELNLKNVVLCYLGGGCFASHYPFDFLNNAYLPALRLALTRFTNGNLPESISIMGNVGESISSGISNLLSEFDIRFGNLGFVPEILSSEDTLYQNAWDPHSMVGNGNKGDNSLDGFFGRSVPMHFLCWPLTNENIQFIGL